MTSKQARGEKREERRQQKTLSARLLVAAAVVARTGQGFASWKAPRLPASSLHQSLQLRAQHSTLNAIITDVARQLFRHSSLRAFRQTLAEVRV